MKTYKLKVVFLIAFIGIFTVTSVEAALVPSLSLSSVTGSNSVQATVIGADPNASVLFYYPSTSSLVSVNIGTTNGSGYLNTTINGNTYNISPGATVYVMVNGQASSVITWPNYTSVGSLSLSQTSVNLSVGQNTIIVAGNGSSLSLNTNSNPSVAGASVTGNAVTINAFNTGNTTITVCSTNIACANIAVSVQANQLSQPAVSFSNNTYNIKVGESLVIPISGSGTFSLSSNSSPSIVTASLSGTSLTVGGTNEGASLIGVCASGSNSKTCSQITINVTRLNSSNNSSTQQTELSVNPNSMTLSVGQTQSAYITGGVEPYYVSTNPSPDIVSANMNGSRVDLKGISAGGVNIKICDILNKCGNVYGYVPQGGVSSPSTTYTPQTQTPVAPVLTSISINTSGYNVGSTITVTFNVNQNVNTPTVSIAGSSIQLIGLGGGPYSGTYTIKGNEPKDIPIYISLSNPAGTTGQAYASINFGAPSNSTSNNTASVINAVSYGSSATFTKYLYEGITSLEVSDPEVIALQNKLKSVGVYSGPVTGYFGPLTKAAVKAYQKVHGLDQLGVVGPSTRALLNK